MLLRHLRHVITLTGLAGFLVLSLLVVGSGQRGAAAAPELSVAVVTTYGPNDGSFGTSLDQTLREIAPDASTTMVDASSAAEMLNALGVAAASNDLVLAHGPALGASLTTTALSQPDTAFVWLEAGRDVVAPNVTSVFVDATDGGRLLGRLAALIDASEHTGFIVDAGSGTQHAFATHFAGGIAQTTSDMSVSTRVAGLSDAPDRGREFATKMNLRGATSLVGVGRTTRNAAVIALEKKIDWYAVGIDYAPIAPSNTVASLVFDFGPSVHTVMDRTRAGSGGGVPLHVNLASGNAWIALNPHYEVSAAIVDEMRLVTQSLVGPRVVEPETPAATTTATPEPATSTPTATASPEPTSGGSAAVTPTAVADDSAATPEPTAAALLESAGNPNTAADDAFRLSEKPAPAPSTATADPEVDVNADVVATTSASESALEPTPAVVEASATADQTATQPGSAPVASAAPAQALAYTGVESKSFAEVGMALVLAGTIMASISLLLGKLNTGPETSRN